MGLEYKAASAAVAEPGVITADEDTGIVEAIVSVTGVVDADNDLIEPGGYAKTLAKRTPKGIFHHDWKKWVSKTLAIEEWLPGDPRLPKTTRDGRPWPPQAGALYVKTQFNLRTQVGRDAFENVKFFADDTEWSIGYKVPPGKAVKDRNGVRRIKEVDLYEYSPVLFGANSMSGTLAVKARDGGDDDGEGDEDDLGEDVDEGTLHQAAEAAVAEDEPPPPDLPDPEDSDGGAVEDGGGEGGPVLEPGAIPVVPDTPPGDGGEPEPDGLSLFDLFGEAPSGAPEDDALSIFDMAGVAESKAGIPGVSDTPSDEASVRRLKRWYVRGEGAARIRWGQPGDFMRCVRIASKYMPPGKAKGFCANRHKDALGVWPGREPGHKKALYDPELEVGPDAGHADPGEMKVLYLPGTVEDLAEQLALAVGEALAPGPERKGVNWTAVDATWPDLIIASRFDDGGGRETFRIPYSIGPDGRPVLGAPEPVSLAVGGPAGQVGRQTASCGKAARLIGHAVAELGSVLPLELKAGRVLSAANERQLRAAVAALVSVLRSAGIDITMAGDDTTSSSEERPLPDPMAVTDTTAPSARANGGAVKMLDPALVARALRLTCP